MADLGKKVAVLASGNGSNFQKIAEDLARDRSHTLALLICDRPGAPCLDRAAALGVPTQVVTYEKGKRAEAEALITKLLEEAGTDLVVLAGFMRLLGPDFVRRWAGKIINIHPTLLPRHPGAHGIADSYHSGDRRLGVTVHWVDEGLDSGPIIAQESFERTPGLTLEQAEGKIHALEHELYPRVVRELLER